MAADRPGSNKKDVDSIVREQRWCRRVEDGVLEDKAMIKAEAEDQDSTSEKIAAAS